MKKLGLRSLGIILSASMMIGTVGCEKKAEVVEGSSVAAPDEASAAGTDEDETAVEPGDETSTDIEYFTEMPGEKWKEKIEGSGSGFEYVDVDVTIPDYIKSEEYSAYTVEMEAFDKDYIHELCDKTFDSGEVEVYDFGSGTKRVYEDMISVYKQAYEMAENVEKYDRDKLKEYVFGFYKVNYLVAPDNIEYRQGTEEFDKAVIERDIAKLEEEAQNAPETIENDYSYQGYIGKIDGEEYYMYFGNRNLNEYYSSIDSTQMNGRVITVMRSDLETMFAGNNDTVELETGQVIEKTEDPDNPLFRKNCLVYDPFEDYLTYDESEGLHEENPAAYDDNMVNEAEAFIKRMGFDSYSFSGWEMPLFWTNAATDKFMYANGYDMTVLKNQFKDGSILRFGISYDYAEQRPMDDIQYDEYMESGDALKTHSYVDVYVNSKGVLGCQIVNPLNITKEEKVNGILDAEEVKDIVRQSVDDKNLWNIPVNGKQVLFNVTDLGLTYFPIHSTDNPEEYTFIPCYILYFADYNDTPLPFLIINAFDGSIIKAEEQMENYPSGWQNGNVGYINYKAQGWPKFSKGEE